MRYNVVLLAATAAAALALTSGPARAGPAATDEPRSLTVRFADLNLASEAGARALLARLHAAADEVCAGPPDLRELERTSRYHGCVNDTVERALRQIRSPQVMAVAHGTAAYQATGQVAGS